MKGKITKIAHKTGKEYPVPYQRVDFVLEDGSWATTNICPSYDNFKFWRGKLQVGNVLDDLHWKEGVNATLNADACPKLLDPDDWTPPPPKPPKPKPPEDPQGKLF